MMKNFLVFLLLICSKDLAAQYIKVDNGMLASNFVNGKNLSLLKSKTTDYYISIGADYAEHKWYYLSSQIGYNTVGGKDTDVFFGNENLILIEKKKYVHANTTFRAFTKSSGFSLFAGLGPYANVLIDSKKFDSELYNPYYEFQTVHFGGKAELGISYNVRNFKIGVVGSYLRNITSVAKSDYIELNNSAYGLALSTGYYIR